MNKTKVFYDLISLILIGLIIYTFAGPTQVSVEDFRFTGTFLFIILGASWLYAIAVFILITKINKSIPSSVIQIGSTIIVGFIILPFILPLLYYLILLRKKL